MTVEKTGRPIASSGSSAARVVGTGIGDKDFLAVSYKSGNHRLALYGADGANWGGVWTYADEIGSEAWKHE